MNYRRGRHRDLTGITPNLKNMLTILIQTKAKDKQERNPTYCDASQTITENESQKQSLQADALQIPDDKSP